MYSFTKTVEHRHDSHLQTIHPLLEKFLNAKLVGKEFENNVAIEFVLDTWPEYLQKNFSFADKSIPRDLRLYLNMNGEINAMSASTQCDYYVAKVINKTETVMQPAMPGL